MVVEVAEKPFETLQTIEKDEAELAKSLLIQFLQFFLFSFPTEVFIKI